MKLLHWRPSARENGHHHVALIFGLGVVGQSINRGLRRLTLAQEIRLPFDWTDDRQQAADFQRIEDTLAAKLGGAPLARISVIWSGGRSGFESGHEELYQETVQFRNVLDFAVRLIDAYPGAHGEVHMISSAGGLFEGTVPCGPGTEPRPLRPYGEGKLAQEAALHAAGFGSAGIYRLSSVYGFVPGGRVGLITALLSNALCSRWTRIFGGVATLRDYVLADDVGGFIADRIAGPKRTGLDTVLLASGRSVSMYEVISLVERVLSVPLLLQFDPHPSNARDMRFLPSALPRGWVPTALDTGVIQLAARLRQRPI